MTLVLSNPCADVPTPELDRQPGEVFKQHPIWSHLWVSDQGRVWSDKSSKFIGRRSRRGSEGKGRENRVLRDADEQSYWRVGTQSKPTRVDVYLHILVLETFVGPRPGDEYQGDHIDRNVSNNRVENLRWLHKDENHPAHRRD